MSPTIVANNPVEPYIDADRNGNDIKELRQNVAWTLGRIIDAIFFPGYPYLEPFTSQRRALRIILLNALLDGLVPEWFDSMTELPYPFMWAINHAVATSPQNFVLPAIVYLTEPRWLDHTDADVSLYRMHVGRYIDKKLKSVEGTPRGKNVRTLAGNVLCPVCGERYASDTHELFNRAKTGSNTKARLVSYQPLLCTRICNTCNITIADRSDVREMLMLRQLDIFGHAFVNAVDGILYFQKSLDMHIPSEIKEMLFI